MTGYSLSDSTTTISGVSTDNASHGDSISSLGTHTYHQHQHQQQPQQQQQQHQYHDSSYHHHSHTANGSDSAHNSVARTSLAGNTSATLNHALTEIDSTPVDENSFADYFFKQQVLGLDSASQVTSSGEYRGNDTLNPQATTSLGNNQSYHHGQSEITAVAAAAAAAVAAAATSVNPSQSEFQSSPSFSHRPPPPGYHSQNATNDDSSHYSPSTSAVMASVPASSANNTTNQHPYRPHHHDCNNNTSGGAGASSVSSCLVDPLPSFLSSLPLPNSLESSKYPSMVSVAGGTHTRNAEEAAMATGNNDLFSAAAVVAAAASGGTQPHPYQTQHMSHAGVHSQPQTSAHHTYDTSSLAFSHSNPGTAAGLSSQDAAAAAAAAAAVLANNTGSTTSPLDLNSYSISAFSRPLSQSSSTAAVLLGSENAGNTTPGREGLSSYSFGSSSLSGTLQSTAGILSPQQQHQQASGMGGASHQQHRSYSDYAYYRSPSTALGISSTSASGTGSSASTALAAGSTAGANGSQLASTMGMGQTTYYQPTTYQQYMRSGSTHPYYYSQIPSRYVPYGACPPIRHFVSPARPFKCPTCEQSFSRNHDLKRHVKIHSGIKPHRCPKCGKSFGRSDALKRHSMVKRCRSSTTIAASSTTAAPVSQVTGIHGQSSQTAVMTSVPSSSRLAASATGGMFGQSAAPGMANNTTSIVSSMLSSRTNAI